MTAEAVAKALGGRKASAAWMCGADGAPPHSGCARPHLLGATVAAPVVDFADARKDVRR
jgi:hypothetical protein